VQRIFCLSFTKTARKTFMWKTFSMQFSVSVGTLYFPLLSGHKAENRKFSTWKLVITKLKRTLGCRLQEYCQKTALAQYFCASASQLWRLAFHSHSSSCYQQGTSHLAEVDVKLLLSLRTQMWYTWYVLYHIIWPILWICRESHNIVCSTAYIGSATNYMAKCVYPHTVVKIENN